MVDQRCLFLVFCYYVLFLFSSVYVFCFPFIFKIFKKVFESFLALFANLTIPKFMNINMKSSFPTNLLTVLSLGLLGDYFSLCPFIYRTSLRVFCFLSSIFSHWNGLQVHFKHLHLENFRLWGPFSWPITVVSLATEPYLSLLWVF